MLTQLRTERIPAWLFMFHSLVSYTYATIAENIYEYNRFVCPTYIRFSEIKTQADINRVIKTTLFVDEVFVFDAPVFSNCIQFMDG